MKKSVIAILSLLALSGCSTPMATQERPDTYYESVAAGQTGDTESLFTSDEAILSAEDIEKALSFRYAVRPLNRIGIVTFGQAFWFGYSEELARSGTDIQAGLVGRLRSSPKVYDASYLPTLLIPQKRTVGHFREAAARYQADLLLVYQASCRTYDKYRFFSPNEAKAYCNVEAVLLDTRTGIVPYTVTATRNFHATKDKEDTNFRETMARAELKALADALVEVGDSVVGFLARTKG